MDKKVMDVEEEKKKKETADSEEKQKEEVAKIYGLSLSNIETVILTNGKRYLKFVNPEDKTIRMIETQKGHNLGEEYKAAQERLSYSQGSDEKANARAIFDYQLRFYNVELKLIPIIELKYNKTAYKFLFDNLREEDKKEVRVLIENMEYLELEYINIENAIGIDKNGRVINSEFNYNTGKCNLATAEIRTHEDERVNTTDDSWVFDVTDDEMDEALDGVVLPGDEQIEEGREITPEERPNPTVRGREINMNYAYQVYRYPEILERSEMSSFDRALYKAAGLAIGRRIEKANAHTKPREYILSKKDNKEAAFVDSIYMALILGFFSGLMIATIILAIRSNI